MGTYEGLILAIGWFVLRFGLPVAITALLIWFFRKLDTRWQAEAKQHIDQSKIERIAPVVRCWLLNDCPEDKTKYCLAFQNQDVPCWQNFRAGDGSLQARCLACRVFRGTPAPAFGD